jgi:hypothetical protein
MGPQRIRGKTVLECNAVDAFSLFDDMYLTHCAIISLFRTLQTIP